MIITFDEIVTLPSRNDFIGKSSYNIVEFLPIFIQEGYLPEKDGELSFDKYSKHMYKIFMFGILPSGEKVAVVLNNIYPYFNIRTDNPDEIIDECKQQGFKVVKFSTLKAKTTKKYNDECNLLKLEFTSLNERTKAINYFSKYQTFHDDASCYYRVVCRDHQVSWTNWVRLKSFKIVKKHPFINTMVTIETTPADLESIPQAEMFNRNELRYDLSIEANFDIETYDPSSLDVPDPVSPTFDMFKIGVGFVTIDGDVFPKDTEPSDPNYHWYKPKGHLAYYSITTAITADIPNRTIILCKNHTEMIMAFGILWRKMQPDYSPNFNGDNYDWRCIAEVARQTKTLEFLERNMSLLKYDAFRKFENKYFPSVNTPFVVKGIGCGYQFWKKYEFKVTAELKVPAAVLNFPGTCSIDMMLQLRQKYNNPDKYSLHYFLGKLNLADKVDMPYQEMFRLRENDIRLQKLLNLESMKWAHVMEKAEALGIKDEVMENARKMSYVTEYCICDALRCHDLLISTCFIRDKRLLGDYSFTSMDDCIYRANGMKVRNLTFSKAAKRKLESSNKPVKNVETGKYPGAYVFPPEKGIATAKPSPDELREKWKLKDETLSTVKKKIKKYGIWYDDYPKEELKDLPEVFVDWLKLKTKYPVAGLDFASLYPSLIMTYNFSPEMMVHSLDEAIELTKQGKDVYPVRFMFNGREIKGWSVRHTYCQYEKEMTELLKNRTQNYTKIEQIQIESEFGLFPSILKELFDDRVVIKSELKPVTKRKEELELLSTDEFKARQEEYKDVMFKYNYLNSKQKALKVFMNTFYGESGNATSSLRVLALAGGVTTSGRKNIKMVADYVLSVGCHIYYGDTDSIYMSMPRENFTEFDKLYYSGEITKEKYFELLVNKSFQVIKKVNADVNALLEKDNGTKFLNMAFEEFLYPAEFSAKKKYSGIAHIGVFNPIPKELFVKGHDYIKKGASDLLVEIAEDILWKALSISNTKSMLQIVEEKIEEVYTNKSIDFDKFIKTATWKPHKKNVAVATFVERMQQIGIPPIALDRFKYVIVKKYPFKFDVRGRKTELSIGERMEYAHRAKELGLEIDMDYYMSSGICGQLARFIAYHTMFNSKTLREDMDEEEITEEEKKATNLANSYILKKYEKYNEKHVSKGPVLQCLYKKVNNVFHDEFNKILKVGDFWNSDSKAPVVKDKNAKTNAQIAYEENNLIFTNLVSKIEKTASTEASQTCDELIAQWNCKTVDDWIEKITIYKKIKQSRWNIFQSKIPQLLDRLRSMITSLRPLLSKRDIILQKCIDTFGPTFTETTLNNLDMEMSKISKLDNHEIKKFLQAGMLMISFNEMKKLDDINNLCLMIGVHHKLYKVTSYVVDNLTKFVQYKLGNNIIENKHTDDVEEWIDNNL